MVTAWRALHPRGDCGSVRLRDLLQPDPQWGPALESNRLPVIAVEADVGDSEFIEEATEMADKTEHVESNCNGYCDSVVLPVIDHR